MSRILPAAKRELILRLLTEGTGVNATARLAGTTTKTVLKLLEDTGKVCSKEQARLLTELQCKNIEVDELRSFVYVKEYNLEKAINPPDVAGTVWTWTAICRDTKLLISYYIADRTYESACTFLDELKSRLSTKRIGIGKKRVVNLYSDGHNAYLGSVMRIFGVDPDFELNYGQIIKEYSGAPRRLTDIKKKAIVGNPESIGTSFVERMNGTIRQHDKRYARKTNTHSKIVDNHNHMLSLMTMYYNFCRGHETLSPSKKRTDAVSPAMAAGVTTRVWTLGDVVKLVEEEYERTRPKTRGPYKKTRERLAKEAVEKVA